MLLLLPTLQLTRAALRHWFTWNCSPQYARITSSFTRLFVAFAGTKHCCLTAINRCGALCCPDFPRDRGLKPQFFFPYPAIDRYTIFVCLVFLPILPRASWARGKRRNGGNPNAQSAFLVASPDLVYPSKLCFISRVPYREPRGLEVRGGMAATPMRKAHFLLQAHSDEERHTGIEPASPAWEADALPMC